jgi:circadian clock protein KaiB
MPIRNHSPRAHPKSSKLSLRVWEFRLYVAGQTPRSLAAIANLKKLCKEHLAGQYSIELVDLLENPRLARQDQVLAIPMLVRAFPEPRRKIVGDLSDQKQVLMELELALPD